MLPPSSWKARTACASTSSPTTAAPCRWTSPACRYCPNTTGSSAILPTAPASTSRSAAGRTVSGASTMAAASPSSATPTGGRAICRSAVAATISTSCASSTSVIPKWRGRCSKAAATTTTANSPPPPTRWATTVRNWTTAACSAPTWARPNRRWPRASCSTSTGRSSRTVACARRWACCGTTSGATGR
ncbi:hypothetical protein D3C81_1262680 [compost metagenome]